MASMSGWFEGAILSLMFVLVLTGVVVYFNVDYSKSNNIGLLTNDTMNDLIGYQKISQDEIGSGEASFTSAAGMTLSSSWTLMKAAISIIWNFITGQWLETICTDYMHLPAVVALLLRILYTISLVWIIIRILFKVAP
jgi:hypothetical protein